MKTIFNTAALHKANNPANFDSTEISIKYISAALARCERNGMDMSGAIATINSKKYFFNIYSVQMQVSPSVILQYLEFPTNLSEACSESELQILIGVLHKEIEIVHGAPLGIDLSELQANSI